MTKLDRYIAVNVLQAMLLVLLILGSLNFIFSLVDEFGETNEVYRAFDAFKYVLLVFPRYIYELLPMTALIGALTGLGVLASSNELVVMQASGVRVERIIWAVMKPALLLVVIGLILGEFVAPRLELQGEMQRSLAKGEEMALSRYGYWQRDDKEFLHFTAIDAAGELRGVSIFSFDDNQQLLSKTEAQYARFETQGSDTYWTLYNGMEQEFIETPSGPVSTNNEFRAKVWPVDLSPDLLKVLIIDPDKMAMSDLYLYANRFRSQGQQSDSYFLSFWKKMLQPLTTAALVLVAISFIFGPLRESTMGSRLFTAICFGIVFIILQRLLSTVSLVYHVNPFLAVFLPILLCAGLGWYLLKKAL